MNKSESFGSQQKKWDAILAAEGMPAEFNEVAAEHTPAYDTAVADLYEYYATVEKGEQSVHRQKIEAVRSRLLADGGTAEEVQALTEDYARGIEDEVADLEKEALELGTLIVNARPMLAGNVDTIGKLVGMKLREAHPELPRTVTGTIAEKMASSV